MINIAITGGIGSGKTQVTNHLISKGFTVVDADRMSREMTSAGGKPFRISASISGIRSYLRTGA